MSAAILVLQPLFVCRQIRFTAHQAPTIFLAERNFNPTFSLSVRRVLLVSYSPGHYLFRISTEFAFDPQVAQPTVQNRRGAFPIIYTSQTFIFLAVENFDLTFFFSVRRVLSVYYSPERISTKFTFGLQVAQQTVHYRRCDFRTVHTS